MFLIDASYWRVQRAGNKGRGVFARAGIDPGTVIGDYIGTVIRPSECDDARGGLYGLLLHDNAVFYPDINAVGVHLINHSCMPNLGMYPYKGHMLYAALRRIFPGEELTVSYMVSQPDSFMEEGLSYPCFCSTPLCTGSMLVSRQKAHDYWDVYVRRKTGSYMNTFARYYGRMLPMLDRYPRRVRDASVFDLSGYTGISPEHIAVQELPNIRRLRSLIRESGACLTTGELTVLAVADRRLVLQSVSGT